jgi:hypothetical protein
MAREWGEELTGALFQEGQAPPLPQARQGAPALELWLDPQRADLPWELLLLKDAQGEPQPLGTRVDLRRRLIRRCSGGPQQESEGSGLRVLLVANPREDHPELEEDLQSTMELLQRLPAAEVWALSGAEAKPGDFQKALRRRPQVLHFAGHGNVDYFRPVASGIFLQGDQLWGSLNLPNDQPLPELWILAACTSLRLPTAGQTHGGKALAQTLLERGVRAVIGSYWDLEVQTARDLSARLYPALLRGERLGPALLEVRQHLYQRGSPDWCNLLLYGDGDWRLA